MSRFLVLLFCASPVVAAPPTIALHTEKSHVSIAVSGLDKPLLSKLTKLKPDAAAWRDTLSVYVERSDKSREGQPAMLGTYRVEKDVVHFDPRFPLTKGTRYRAVLALDGKEHDVTLSIPKPKSVATTTLTAVYPTLDKLPENQLKFYLHFSAPMSQGKSYQHIHLLDAKGKEIDLPFLELDQELWTPDGKRFTLFFDPGRIKRGLKPRKEVGPALEEGKSYTLVIDRAWKDEDGNELKASFRKSFSVGPPDDTQPDMKTWKVKAPAAESRSALRVTFPKAMEHGLLHRMIWIEDAKGNRVPGEIAVSERETVWSYTPTKEWVAGKYRIVADTQLEDLAGNSLGRPFEVDILRPVERKIVLKTMELAFEVK